MFNRQEYTKKYYQENKEKLKKYKRKEYQEHKEKYRERRNKNRQRYNEKAKSQRNQALTLYKNRCFFCRVSKKRLVFHEKSGKPHPSKVAPFVLKNPDDFSLLCIPCHKAVHWVMKYLRLSWEEILSYLDK